MNLVIVEDEAEILAGMKDTLAHLDERINEIFAFASAEQALAHMREFRSEILITDIVLPEMTGLDLIEQVAELDYSPKTIVVSSHVNFSFAQRSLRLGALDYIIKPFDREEFKQKIKQLVDLADADKQISLSIKNQTRVAELGTKALRENFILSLCMRRTELQESLYHRLQFWNLTWLTDSPYHVIALSTTQKQDIPEKEADLQNFAIGNIAEEIIGHDPATVLLRNHHQIWVIVTANECPEMLIQDVDNAIRQYQRISVAYGISSAAHAFQALSSAYNQATQALKLACLNPDQRMIRYEELPHETGEDEQDGRDRQLLAALQSEDYDRSNGIVDDIFERFVLSSEVKRPQEVSHKCFDWMINLQMKWKSQFEVDMGQAPMELWEQMEECGSLSELRQLLKIYLQQLSQKVVRIPSSGETGSHESGNAIVEQAKRYIEGHFPLVSLQAVADGVNLHPVWLSQMFKKETGQNFHDYVTDLRMKKAKQLLLESSLKIYEIAAAVGYQDLQHFGRVFKKTYLLTPKEFRYGK